MDLQFVTASGGDAPIIQGKLGDEEEEPVTPAPEDRTSAATICAPHYEAQQCATSNPPGNDQQFMSGLDWDDWGPLEPAAIASEQAPRAPAIGPGCQDIRTLIASGTGDRDRISSWQIASRVSHVPDAPLQLNGRATVAKCNVRGREWTWTFRDIQTADVLGKAIVGVDRHPLAVLKSIWLKPSYRGRGLTREIWTYLEEVLMEHDFDDIEFESASRDVRYGSMIMFYESEGIVLPPVQESPTTVDWSRMAEHECFNDSHISEGARELSSESGSGKSDTPTGSHVHHSGHAASWSAGAAAVSSGFHQSPAFQRVRRVRSTDTTNHEMEAVRIF